jgi:hypothetical protein
VMGVSPVAASVWLYGVPVSLFGNDVVVIVGAVPVLFPGGLEGPPPSPQDANIISVHANNIGRSFCFAKTPLKLWIQRHPCRKASSVSMSENVRIVMNLGREIGGGGGSCKFVCCHGVYGYFL